MGNEQTTLLEKNVLRILIENHLPEMSGIEECCSFFF